MLRKLRTVRIVYILVAGVLCAGGVLAGDFKSGGIAGSVVNATDESPLAAVNISLDSTAFGCSTDAQGSFLLRSIPPGNYLLVARLLGFSEFRKDIVVEEDSIVRIRISLKESPIALQEVQVSAERSKRQGDIRASVLSITPTRTRTLAGVAEDVLRTLQSMPGVLAPNDFSSQLVIRGSGPEQNLIIMDDIEVFNPYRLYGIISMFNPETVADINLITGGFPARYGDRLSAVLDVTNKEGDKSRALKGSVNASITNANVVLDGRSPFGIDGSYVVSARRTYYDLILGPIARNTGLVKGDVAFPNFRDLQAKIVLEPWSTSKFILNGIASNDAVDVVSGPDRKAPDSVNVRDNTRNDVAGITWHFFPSRNVLVKTSLSWYRNSGDSEFGGEFVDPSLNHDLYNNLHDTTGIRFFTVEFDSRYRFLKTSVKQEGVLAMDRHTIEGGYGIDFLETSLTWHFRPDATFRSILQARGVPFLDDFVQTKKYRRLNFYLQDNVKITDKLTVQGGLRFDYYEIIRASEFQPRLNVSYALDPLTTVRAAYGWFRQSPGYEKLLDQNTFLDLTNSSVGNLRAERATHYVLGVDRWLDSQWLVRLEGYRKAFDDVIVQDLRRGTVFATYAVAGADPRKISGWTQPVPVQGD